MQNFAKKGAPVIREAIANEIIPQDFYILTLSFQDRRPASGQPFLFSLALSRIRTAVSDFKSLAKVVRYLKAGPNIAIEGGKMMKELLKKMNQQKKEIRQYKQDYSEAGELKDPTISAEEIDAHYSNNEPITKLSEEYNNAIAEIQAKDSSIQVPEDGDADIDGL